MWRICTKQFVKNNMFIELSNSILKITASNKTKWDLIFNGSHTSYTTRNPCRQSNIGGKKLASHCKCIYWWWLSRTLIHYTSLTKILATHYIQMMIHVLSSNPLHKIGQVSAKRRALAASNSAGRTMNYLITNEIFHLLKFTQHLLKFTQCWHFFPSCVQSYEEREKIYQYWLFDQFIEYQ